MPTTVAGTVRDGKVIPKTPLPEGIEVEIIVPEDAEPADLQEELDQWALGSAQALDLVERLADQEPGNEKG